MAIAGSSSNIDHVTLFLCGDVMTGRGIDQILPHPGSPELHEPYMRVASGYVSLAERVSGPITRPVGYAYIWGDALAELQRVQPHVRIINLETSVTTSGEYWPGKGINYRMHPANLPCLNAAAIDCCVLANNHVMDWGLSGLIETLDALDQAQLKHAGAGRNGVEAEAPAVVDLGPESRVLIFSFGTESSGIPRIWAADADRPGVNLLTDLSEETIRRYRDRVITCKRKGDLAVASIHWGGNWGYAIPREHIHFAHQLIDEAGIDIVHGHSSHHVKGIEVHHGKLILYGCGDFFNDYEGIGGYEQYRGDLVLMYFAQLEAASGKLVSLQMTPMQIRQFSLQRANRPDVLWLHETLTREGRRFGTQVRLDKDGNTLELAWS